MSPESRRSPAGAATPERVAAPVRDTEAGKVPLTELAAYGALGLPLAFAALPIYVHVPRLYAEGTGLSLALVGAVLQIGRASWRERV